MSRRKVVNKQAKKISLVVYHDEMNSCELLGDVLVNVLGWENSQAENGANIIFYKGSYVVKTFKLDELDRAKAYEDAFNDNEIPVKLLIH